MTINNFDIRGASNGRGSIKHDSQRYGSSQSGQYDFEAPLNRHGINLNLNSSRLKNIKTQMNQSGYDTTFRAFSTKRHSHMNSTQRDTISVLGTSSLVKDLMANNLIQFPKMTDDPEGKKVRMPGISPQPKNAIKRVVEGSKPVLGGTSHVILSDTTQLADMLPEIPKIPRAEAKSVFQEQLQ
jgi:hypothetical protein